MENTTDDVIRDLKREIAHLTWRLGEKKKITKFQYSRSPAMVGNYGGFSNYTNDFNSEKQKQKAELANLKKQLKEHENLLAKKEKIAYLKRQISVFTNSFNTLLTEDEFNNDSDYRENFSSYEKYRKDFLDNKMENDGDLEGFKKELEELLYEDFAKVIGSVKPSEISF